MSDFVSIPGRPGYSIDRQGRVESERSGLLLMVDKWGRVRLRDGGKQINVYIGDLLADAGFFTPPAPEPDVQSGTVIAELERRLAEEREANSGLRKKLDRTNFELKGAQSALEAARKANDLLLGIRKNLTRENERLRGASPSAPAPRRGRPRKADEPDAAPNFIDAIPDDWEEL